MSKGKYYPKGPKGGKANPSEMLKQLAQVQEQMQVAQEALADETVEYAAGGGAVLVVADGHQKVRSITIDPQAVDPEDVSMLEDLVLVAVNGALEKAGQLAEERMSGLAGGLGLPGM